MRPAPKLPLALLGPDSASSKDQQARTDSSTGVAPRYDSAVRRGLLLMPFVLLVGCTATATRQYTYRNSEPTLILSVHRGGPGTRVRVKGVNCPPLVGERDQLSWHDSYQLSHRFSGNRKVQPLHRVGKTVTATFRVLHSDHRGKGLLDLFCGGNGGNAVQYFVVTR